ncbi:3-isopropylmalate dehydratase small subunit [Roseateles chitinivorans]|uniref:3-isopropylmalate dehydratase small subunit n=1 Tax=Roseateles chitinivorans TaxID=2917965 RepID=A0A2G9CAY6_9BURK|nr:3-isopropylmalate dehydratase small subunit [Roseateles chitinivorans]PIM53587.1 3-isopropylmalate dehydratase small subunit [Roseateles chitinivorans]
MNPVRRIEGRSAALRLENLDTDQIMPKQFLRGIDKQGLREGLLHDLRFDGEGRERPGFVLNQPAYADVSVLIGGNNFGCGSSREHAVWGLQQAGIRAVVAPGFGEIFYSNAMGNGLLLVSLPEAQVRQLMDEADAVPGNVVTIDVETLSLRSAGGVEARFEMLPRHQRMLLEGLDAIGLSMTYRDRIEAFAAAHWAAQPWLRDVARAGGRR